MGKGYILVRLFRVKNALPETKGSLKITDAKSGKIIYNNNNAFDISGRSELIEVDTPDESLSQEPYEEGIIPYGKYNLDILSEGSNEVIVQGVSVFENITSIQNIELEEKKDLSIFSSAPEVILIPDEQLVLKGLRNKQEGTMVLPFVLDRPYIPEFIVVHLGTPSSNAENVTVGFVDYIKNVASSEIYPTWPEESLKANIYCQISFALNRIYTEWYRNKGYPFQITNSTAYDQYFIKGRNIFDNISKIVDEIFSKYIITIGSKTPFFAQYCNGTTVTCAGLSQWGTVDLANRGKDALEIIRYYFGYDKDLIRATIIEGIPESYPGTPLRLNDVNENVKVIQKQLNRIAVNFPAIPKIPDPNGIFDKQTQDSVKTFQKIFNLTQDGIVGRATWYKISGIYVAVKRLAELNPEPEIEEDGAYPGYVLRYGSTGEKVKEMQSYLAEISNYHNIPMLRADGIFGNATKETVIAFQRLFGLTPDGLVGVNTWTKIYEIYKKVKNQGNPQYPNPEFDGKYPGNLISYGSRGEKVREIQTYLSVISNYYNIPNIKPDGIFGNATRDSVLAFQRLFGLAQDGIVGYNTWTKVYEIYKGIPKVTMQQDLTPIYNPNYPGYVLKENSGIDDVKWLQTYLQAISQYYDTIPNINVDGKYYKDTQNAVRDFQKTFGLKITGVIDVNDWNKLISVYNSLDSDKNINESDILYGYPGIELKLGDENGYITILQNYINVIAKNNYKIKEIPITGSFDKNTEGAVKSLQKLFDLKVTGIVDEITWNKISSAYEDLYTGKQLRSKYNNKRKSNH